MATHISTYPVIFLFYLNCIVVRKYTLYCLNPLKLFATGFMAQFIVVIYEWSALPQHQKQRSKYVL